MASCQLYFIISVHSTFVFFFVYVFILLYAAPSAEWWSIDRECWWCVRAWCHWFKNPLYIAVHGILVGICYAAIKCFLNSKRSCSTHTTHVQIKYKCTNVDDARTRIWRCKMLVYIYATELSIHDLNARYTQNAKWISIYLFFYFRCRLPIAFWLNNKWYAEWKCAATRLCLYKHQTDDARRSKVLIWLSWNICMQHIRIRNVKWCSPLSINT